MNYDLAVVLCLADEGKNRPFDEYVAGIVGRMLENVLKKRLFWNSFRCIIIWRTTNLTPALPEWLMRIIPILYPL